VSGPLPVVAHDRFEYPLPEGHRFPLGRYRMLREALEGDPAVAVRQAERADDTALLLAHTPAYLARAVGGRLTAREVAALGLPWSPQLVERARRSVGATVQAARAALEGGRAVNLGGGTHHAAPDAGRGFCMFNDVAVAVRVLRRERLVDRVLVVDLDVHQGDGTHACFAADRRTVTTSVNGGRNYPFRRVPGDIEEELPDGTRDGAYLAAVGRVLAAGLARGRPDLIVLLAGADPWEGDRLGRLRVSAAGLATRDRMVRDAAGAAGAPLCVTLAGGYGEPIEGTVAVNRATVAAMI
jgi:acetoin utilization deacetylase AcuC-like enzyme